MLTQNYNGAAAETATHVAWLMARDPRWDAWYDPDEWDGFVGFVQHILFTTESLEVAVQEDGLAWGDDLDWYSTCERLVEALFANPEASISDIRSVYAYEGAAPPQPTPLSSTITTILCPT